MSRCERFEDTKDLGELSGLVAVPILLGCETDPGTVGAAAVVGSTEGGCTGPSGFNHLGNGETVALDGVLQGADVIGRGAGGDRVLPDEVLIGDVGTEVAGLGAHVPVQRT